MQLNILHLPLAFFDTTSLGRVVDRFSKDVDVIDAVLANSTSIWIRCCLQVVATVVVISMSTPIFLVVILPLSGVYFVIQVLLLLLKVRLDWTVVLLQSGTPPRWPCG